MNEGTAICKHKCQDKSACKHECCKGVKSEAAEKESGLRQVTESEIPVGSVEHFIQVKNEMESIDLGEEIEIKRFKFNKVFRKEPDEISDDELVDFQLSTPVNVGTKEIVKEEKPMIKEDKGKSIDNVRRDELPNKRKFDNDDMEEAERKAFELFESILGT
jgi:hypothetical protein